VNWKPEYGLWCAEICDLVIGHFTDEISAAQAWNDKISELGVTTDVNNLEFLHA
jgi:hypothetical protein